MPTTGATVAESQVVQISPDDNIAVAVSPIAAGETVTLAGQTLSCRQEIPAGHKIALTAITAGEKVLKYGAPIGIATCDIQPGDWVHTHNLKSDYLATHTRET